MKRREMVKISYELLAKLLDLPDDHEVINVLSDTEDMGSESFRVVIRGPHVTKIPEAMEMIPISWENLMETIQVNQED